MKKVYWLLPVGVLAAIQLIRPDISNPPVDPAQDIQRVAQTPAAVQSVLQAACYDCHSNETKYPWYSQIAPVSWFVADHIREGREALNFSTFGALSAEDRGEAMEEAGENLQEGEMPLFSYTWIHPEARLDASQRDLLIQWFNSNSGEGGEAGGAGEQNNPAKGQAETEADDD